MLQIETPVNFERVQAYVEEKVAEEVAEDEDDCAEEEDENEDTDNENSEDSEFEHIFDELELKI